MSSSTALTHIDDSLLAETHLEKVASGKVRELYAVDDKSLLFVATDRISAYDVVLNNVSYPHNLIGKSAADRARVYPTKADCSLNSLYIGSHSYLRICRMQRHTSSHEIKSRYGII